jgi:hypothetical protein
MNGLRANWRQRVAKMGATARLFVLLAAMTVLFALVAPIAWYVAGQMGIIAATVAALACLLGGAAALVAGEFLRDEKAAAARMMVEMLLRMGLPLATCIVVFLKGRPLIDAGFAFYLLAFYLPLLTVEILLSLARVESRAAADKRVTAYGG